MKKLLSIALFIASIASITTAQDWQNCPTEEVKPLTGFKPLTAATEQIMTYRIDFAGDLKVGGKAVPRAEVREIIDKALATAYGDKLGIEFKLVTGNARFVYRVENHRDRYRGTHFSDQHIMLHSAAPWSKSGIAIIAAHEMGHSYSFFGKPQHNSGSFTENGVRYSHLMHPDDGRTPKYKMYPTYTSPQETAKLVARYGKQPDSTPTPPRPPTPTPTPTPSTKITIEAESYTTAKGVSKGGTGDTGGGQVVTFIGSSDTMDYKFAVGITGDYKVAIRAGSFNSGAKGELQLNGKTLTTFNVPKLGWDKYGTVTKTVKLTKGNYTLRVKGASSAWWSLNRMVFTTTATPAPPEPVDPKVAAIKKLQAELTALRKTRDKHKSDLATHTKAVEAATKKRNTSKAGLDATNKTIAAKNNELAELTK